MPDDLDAELSTIIKELGGFLHGHLCRLLGDGGEVEDLFQELLIVYFRNRSRGTLVKHPWRYLYRVATRLAITHVEKARRETDWRVSAELAPPPPSKLATPSMAGWTSCARLNAS